MRRLIRTFLAYFLALGFTAFFFMLLPLLQAINSPFQGDSMVRTMEIVSVPPPPPPPMDEPDDPEPEPEPDPPKMVTSFDIYLSIIKFGLCIQLVVR